MSEVSRRPLGLLLGGLAVAALVGTTIAAIGGSDDSRPADGARERSYVTARNGVCVAAEKARRGDLAAARTVFFDQSHLSLHELAADAQRTDRSAAARLLEAKERAETSIERSGPSAAEDLAGLADASGQAIAATGGDDPGPCPP